MFTLFFFVLMGNLLGLIPFAFTYTSHIAVTAALAIMVIVHGDDRGAHGTRPEILHLFLSRSGAPIWLAPLIVPIEIISYLSRPVSLSVRLFANMVAGHVMFAVFATFIVMLGGIGVVGMLGAAGPAGHQRGADRVRIAGGGALQAYVFAILTCIYLHDAVHLH